MTRQLDLLFMLDLCTPVHSTFTWSSIIACLLFSISTAFVGIISYGRPKHVSEHYIIVLTRSSLANTRYCGVVLRSRYDMISLVPCRSFLRRVIILNCQPSAPRYCPKSCPPRRVDTQHIRKLERHCVPRVSRPVSYRQEEARRSDERFLLQMFCVCVLAHVLFVFISDPSSR